MSSRIGVSGYTIFIFIISIFSFVCKFVDNTKDVIVVVILVVCFERSENCSYGGMVKKKCISITYVDCIGTTFSGA